MKKVIGILCVFALLIGITSVAMADATNWTLNLQATTATYGSKGGSVAIGTKSNSDDTKDANDAYGSWASTTGGYANAYEAGWGSTPATYLGKADYVKNYDYKTTSHSWDILVFAYSGYTGTSLKLSCYGSGTYAVPSDMMFTFQLLDAEGNVDTTKVAKTMTGVSTNSSSAPYDLWEWTTFPKVTEGSAASSAIKIRVTAGFVPQENTPEPGSLLALGSGLVGLVGFAIRRRR